MAEEGWRHIGLWRDVTEEEWLDWRWQLRSRITKFEELKSVINPTPEEEEGTRRVVGRLIMAVTPYWATLMDANDPNCPIRRQAVPLSKEFSITQSDMLDPLCEDRDARVPGLVHRYPDRVLLLATERCATYCRHCTRRRLVGCEDKLPAAGDLSQAFDYIKSNKRIRDVLISGGDPLTLSDEKLEEIVRTVRSISHVEVLRIGTRVPVTLPMRVTDSLVSMLKKYSPIWISIHFNHHREITPAVRRACAMLADGGFPLGSQTVLLKGINDRPYVMKKLMCELLRIRVRPYYIYQCDPARGINHFRTSVAVGINIMEKLRGHISGYAVPTYVVDAPGGGGKIPVTPNYVLSQANGVFTLRNYKGETYSYNEPLEEVKPQVVPVPAAAKGKIKPSISKTAKVA